jgi:DNA-binding PadR family transcriptional regulator
MTVLLMLGAGPLHPYEMQRRIKLWGKDQVVNVGQRAGLYRTIDRLLAAGLVAVRETGRDQQYPERTVYELTDAGRETFHAWLTEMLATPKAEFPEFPAALSTVMLLAPQEAERVLARRVQAVAATLTALDADLAGSAEYGLPRVTLLETEYLRAVTAAERDWLEAVLDDLRSGRLAWEAESLLAVAAEQAEQPLQPGTASE